MVTIITIAIILSIGAIYVLIPVSLSVYSEFRKPREVLCPEDNQSALVNVDARHAAATAAFGAQSLRLSGCSRWPERAGCHEGCLGQITP
jgi:hypothetical protein